MNGLKASAAATLAVLDDDALAVAVAVAIAGV